MKKSIKTLFILACSAVLFAGCAKDELIARNGDGEMTQVTFTAAIPTDMATKAVADNDGNALSVNRCIMEIYYGDDLFARKYSKVDSQKKASFSIQLVANRTYTVAFWADCVTDNTTDAAIATDLYYTTTSLKAVSINGDYVGNNDARDAFFHCGSYTVAQNGSAWSDIKLYRPFAQMNVITTDVATVAKIDGLKPDNVNLTIKNAATAFNVVDGSTGTNSNLTYTTSIYKWKSDTTACTLSMDYLFATDEQAVIDIDWKATKANSADVSHTFSNIPYQRNYRTNIKGALLTTTGEWNVTVDPAWTNNGTGEFEVIVLVANTIEDAQTLIENHAGEDHSVTQTVEIQVKEEISTTKELCIPDNTSTPNWVFKIESMTENGQIVVKDANPQNSDVNYKYSAEVALPSGISSSQTTFNTPNAHGVVSGDFGRIDATTSATTLEIKADATVDDLYVHKGNVALYGQVDHIYRAKDNSATVTVNIYDGAVWTYWDSEKNSTGITPIVNLGTYTFDPTGYNVEGSTVFANTGSSTWTVSVTDEWQYYTAESFSNIDETNKVITIMNATELAKFAKDIATLGDYSVVLGTDIDLSAHNWNPIASFTKTFDGNNRTISGMTVNGTNNLGLFASTGTSATIKDLTITGAKITSTSGSNHGVLAGSISGSTVTNVTIQNSIVTAATGQYTGGMVGTGYPHVSGCTVKGCAVTGYDQVGGLIGYQWVGYIENSTVQGNSVTATSERAGALVGKLQIAAGNTGSSKMWIDGNTIKATLVQAPDMAGGVAGQIMGDMADWSIKDNIIDITSFGTTPKTSPIGILRTDNKLVFNQNLAKNITGNTWTTATLDADRYTYTCDGCDTTFDDQIIWNGTPEFWTGYAAESFTNIDKDQKTLSITTPEELARFGKVLNSKGSFNGYTVTIANNLDMSAHYWEPINAKGCGDLTNATIKGATSETTIDGLKIKSAVNMAADPQTTYNYYSGFIGQSNGIYTIKDLTFNNADVNVYNGSGVSVVVGLTYSPITIENVTVNNSTVFSCTKTGALIGFTGSGKITPHINNCTVSNTTVKAYYSYAIMVGLVNKTDSCSFEGTNSADGSKAVCDHGNTADPEYSPYVDIAGYTYGVEGNDLWVTGVQNAWAEMRVSNAQTTIESNTYNVQGSKFYHPDSCWVDVLAK